MVGPERLDWADLSNVFTPDSAIISVNRLFSRRDQMQALLQAHARRGGLPILSGTPGIGKTSLMNVASGILRGFTEDLEALDLAEYAPPSVDRLVIWLACKPEQMDASMLAESINDSVHSALSDGGDAQHYGLRSFSIQATVPFAKFEGTWERLEENRDVPPIRLLQANLRAYCAAIDGEVVIMLDECERLPWLSDLLNFAGHFDEDIVRFVFALRDQAEYELRSGPSGDYRFPIDIPLRPLDAASVFEMFRQASGSLWDLGAHVRFPGVLLDEIFQRSQGEPWYLQAIGSELLERWFEDSRQVSEARGPTLGIGDLNYAEERVVSRRLRSVWGRLYASTISGTRRRAEVLQLLAAYPETIVPHEFLMECGKSRGFSVTPVLKRLGQGEDPILTEHLSPARGYSFTRSHFRMYCKVGDVGDDGTRELARMMVRRWVPSKL